MMLKMFCLCYERKSLHYELITLVNREYYNRVHFTLLYILIDGAKKSKFKKVRKKNSAKNPATPLAPQMRL